MGPGAQNTLMGDAQATELPQRKKDEKELKEEMAMARFAKSKEFKQLKEYLEDRIKFYQENMPNGLPLEGVDQKTAQEMWLPANVIIKELKAVIAAYEFAGEAVPNGQ